MCSHEKKQYERNHSKRSNQGCLVKNTYFFLPGFRLLLAWHSYTKLVQQVHTSVSCIYCVHNQHTFLRQHCDSNIHHTLNYFRESSILPFSLLVLFFQVMIARVKHPSLLKVILGKTWNETECWQKPFRAKFRRRKKPTYIQACIGRRKIQLFHALAGIQRCIKLA